MIVSNQNPGINFIMTAVAGVILAGGHGSRMGNLDKSLLPLRGKPIIRHVIDRASPQIDRLVISVNRNLERYRDFNLPLITDLPATCEGPLLGIYSAMHWFHRQQNDIRYMACFPADVPVFPGNLVRQMKDLLVEDSCSRSDRERLAGTVAWCQTGDQVQPLFSLWPLTILSDLETAISRGIHGPRLFFSKHPNVTLRLPSPEPPEFFNINTPDQLDEAEILLKGNSSTS